MPELRQRSAVELDPHPAVLVWAPLNELEEKPDFQKKGETNVFQLMLNKVFVPLTFLCFHGTYF